MLFSNRSEYDVVRSQCVGFISGLLLSIYASNNNIESYPAEIRINKRLFRKIGEACMESLNDFEQKTEMDPIDLRALQSFFRINDF